MSEDWILRNVVEAKPAGKGSRERSHIVWIESITKGEKEEERVATSCKPGHHWHNGRRKKKWMSMQFSKRRLSKVFLSRGGD